MVGKLQEHRTIGLMDFIHCPVSKRRKEKNTTFQRLELSSSSGGWDKIKPTQLSLLEGAPSFEHQTMDEVISPIVLYSVYHRQNHFKTIQHIVT
jgi:hypothetical protein